MNPNKSTDYFQNINQINMDYANPHNLTPRFPVLPNVNKTYQRTEANNNSPCFSFSNEILKNQQSKINQLHEKVLSNQFEKTTAKLKKRSFDNFDKKIFLKNHEFSDDYLSFDSDFLKNQKMILKYISKLCDSQKNIILNNIRNINSIKYIFHRNQTMYKNKLGGINLNLEPKKFVINSKEIFQKKI